MSDAYGDLEVQVLEINHSWELSNMASASEVLGPFTSLYTIDPVNGHLDAHEAAELVAVERQAQVAYNGADTAADDEAVTNFWEFREVGQPSVMDQSKQVDNASEGANNELSVNLRNVDATPYDKGKLTAHSSWEDTTNTEGGGGAPQEEYKFVNFRHEFGEGPIHDEADNLTMDAKATYNGGGSGSGVIRFDADYVLYWDVFQIAEPIERRR